MFFLDVGSDRALSGKSRAPRQSPNSASSAFRQTPVRARAEAICPTSLRKIFQVPESIIVIGDNQIGLLDEKDVRY